MKTILQILVVPIVFILLLPLLPFLILAEIFWRKYRRLTNNHPWQWYRARRGWGKDVVELARRLGVSFEELQAVEPTYKDTYIPKKRGGTRRLFIPEAALKKLQRR